MKKTAVAVLFVLVLVALIGVGCQSSTPTPPPNSTRAPTQAPLLATTLPPTPTIQSGATQVSTTPTPNPSPTSPSARKPEGKVTYAVSGFDMEYWLPFKSNAYALQYTTPFYEYLIDRDPANRKLLPSLAKKWTISPDGLVYTFDLQQGVQFHDGWGEFTSDDVKLSVEMLTRTDAITAVKSYISQTIDKVEAVDKYTVRFVLKKPSVDLLYYLSETPQYIPIISKKYVDSVGVDRSNARPIGTGPYKFVEHVTGDHMTYEALDQHWRQVPYYKTLVIRVIPEEATRIAMLKSGDADAVEMSLAYLSEMNKAGLAVKTVPQTLNYYLSFGGLYLPTNANFDPKLPWTGDPNDKASQERALKVRRALSMAIDRDSLVKSVAMGKGSSSAVIAAWKSMGSYDPNWKPTAFDPASAKKLLADAGYPNGFEITVLSMAQPSMPSNTKIAQAVGMMWEQNLGMKVKFVATDWAATRPKALNRTLSGVILPYARIVYDNPGSALLLTSHSKAGTMIAWEDAYTDKLLDEFASTGDQAKADEIQRKILQYSIDNQLVIPTIYTDSVIGINTNKIADWPFVDASAFMNNAEFIRPPGK